MLTWKAHCNVVLVTNIGLGEYLVKYISKAEPTLGAKISCKSDVERYLNFRVVSQPEAFLTLCGHHRVQATREVIFLNTDHPLRRWRRILPIEKNFHEINYMHYICAIVTKGKLS